MQPKKNNTKSTKNVNTPKIIKNSSGWCICNHCKAVLKTGRTRKFCDKKCDTDYRNALKRAKTAAKRKKVNDAISIRSPFTYYLAKQCIRARTLDIVAGITLDELVALHTVWKQCGTFNGWGANKADPYELSHIVPVKHPTVIGLLRADNLVIAPRSFNRKHGTTTYSLEAGRYLPRTSLSGAHLVYEDAQESDVADRLIRAIGTDLYTDFAIKVKLKAATRYKHLEKLERLLDLSRKDHQKIWKDAQDGTTTTPELAKIIARLQDKFVSDFSFSASSIEDVLKSEVIRLSATRADVAELATRLTLNTDEMDDEAFNVHHFRQYIESRYWLRDNADDVLRKLHGEGFVSAADVAQAPVAQDEYDVFAGVSVASVANAMKENTMPVGTTVTHLERSSPTLSRAPAFSDISVSGELHQRTTVLDRFLSKGIPKLTTGVVDASSPLNEVEEWAA